MKNFDLRLNVLGVDREMINAVGYAHDETLLLNRIQFRCFRAYKTDPEI